MDKYVYEICPYKDAHQKDGASSISLGSWKGFEDDYGSMVFSGGQHCWNGPMRSIKVPIGVECVVRTYRVCARMFAVSLSSRTYVSMRCPGVASTVQKLPAGICISIRTARRAICAVLAPCRCLCRVEPPRC